MDAYHDTGLSGFNETKVRERWIVCFLFEKIVKAKEYPQMLRMITNEAIERRIDRSQDFGSDWPSQSQVDANHTSETAHPVLAHGAEASFEEVPDEKEEMEYDFSKLPPHACK